uniref:rhodopsin, GQ-coupled-like n=1 Tax=Styela clava TaxID=7725 RepID=UPI00193A2B95|nr:rhodopsin, GQ-coupled-like [Styela clava]
MAVFGIIANLVTIIVITKSKKLSRSVFNRLIVSLCVSDLFSAIISPLSLHRRTSGYDNWILPEFFCKVFWSVDNWTSFVTSLHILIFAGIRMASIKSSTYYQKITIKHVKIMVTVIWLSTFGSGFIPLWLWFGVKYPDRPANAHGTNWPDCTLHFVNIGEFKLYVKIAFTVFYYIPMVAISILSPAIAIFIIRKRRQRAQRRNPQGTIPNSRRNASEYERKKRRKENSAIIQLGVIVGSFMLGYIPNSVYSLYATAAPQSTLQEQIFHWHFGSVSYILLRLSECLNPIFYNVASSKMRKETILFLKTLMICCLPRCCKPITIDTVGITTNSSTSNASRNRTRDIEL